MTRSRYSILMVWFNLKKIVKLVTKQVIPEKLWKLVKKKFPTRLTHLWAEAYLIRNWHVARDNYSKKKTDNNKMFGINIVGYLRSITGLGEAARSSILALQAANIPFGLIDYDFGDSPNKDVGLFTDREITNEFLYNINIIHVNPPQMPFLFARFGGTNLANKYNIGVWYWEMSEFPDEWIKYFDVVDEVWVATNFVKNAISAKSSVPIVRIPPAVRVEYAKDLCRADFGLPEGRFLFLCSFDVLSVHDRKNPEGAIDAFKKAFKQDDKSVGLVIKINNSNENKYGVKRLKDKIQGYSNCYFIEETFPRKKFNALLNLIDVYISLHRSEGFGLIPAEAMYLGKPVVLTNWSGITDFATEMSTCLVNYRLIPVGPNMQPYNPDQYWADPDIDHAVEYLIRLRSDPKYYGRKSEEAARTIKEGYSPEFIGEVIRKRMREIGYI